MASNLTKSASSLLPYVTIEAAASGDVDAINAVLKFYKRYISALSTRALYDENGKQHLYVDEEMKGRMEVKLVTRILSFDAQKTA